MWACTHNQFHEPCAAVHNQTHPLRRPDNLLPHSSPRPLQPGSIPSSVPCDDLSKGCCPAEPGEGRASRCAACAHDGVLGVKGGGKECNRCRRGKRRLLEGERNASGAVEGSGRCYWFVTLERCMLLWRWGWLDGGCIKLQHGPRLGHSRGCAWDLVLLI